MTLLDEVKVGSAVTFGVALAFLLVMKFFLPAPPAINTKALDASVAHLHAANDSLAVLRQENGALRTELTLRALDDEAVVSTMEDSVDAAIARLARLSRPAPQDSINPQWERIVVRQDTLLHLDSGVVSGLHLALARKDSIAVLDSAQRERDSTQLVRTQHVLDSAMIAVHQRDCHLLHFFPCPTRKQVLVGTVVTTLAVDAVVRHNKKRLEVRLPW